MNPTMLAVGVLLVDSGFAPWTRLADAMLGWVGQALLLGTAAALATWLMLVVLRGRLRPSVQMAFWLVVLVRFVVPDGPQFSYSLASMLTWMAPAVAATPAALKPAAGAEDNGRWQIIPITVGLGAMPSDGAKPAAAAPFWSGVPWRAALASGYVAAVSLIVLVRILRYRRFVRAAAKLSPADAQTTALVLGICAGRGVYRLPLVRVSDAAPAPFVFGLFRPTLVLARRMLACPLELEAVVLHEIAHLRRGDLWARGLQCLAGTLLFFWPVVAWVNRRIDLAREHACDEWALRHSRLSPGEYARCLLRAAQPRGAHAAGYSPAAMAANLSHVERRIDMILKTTSSTRGGMLRFLATGTLLGWSAFVLTGAAASKPSADDARQPVEVQTLDGDLDWVEDDGAFEASSLLHLRALHERVADGFLSRVSLLRQMLGEQTALTRPDDGMMILQEEIIDADGVPLRLAMIRGPGDAARGAFLAAHPTADADGDGTLSEIEHNAYLVAQAMTVPAAVLAQYPSGDLDADGELSAEEAAQLIVAGPIAAAPAQGVRFLRLGTALDAQAGTRQFSFDTKAGAVAGEGQIELAQPAEHDVVVVRGSRIDPPANVELQLEPSVEPDGQLRIVVNADTSTADARQVFVRKIRSAPDGNGGDADAPAGGVHVFAMRAHALAEHGVPMPPPLWIAENIDVVPTVEQVAQYVPIAEQAPLAAFLRMNPRADADNDGVLTTAERDAFLAQHQGRVRGSLLKLHPEADSDGDGNISDAEMQGLLNSKPGAERGVHRIILKGSELDSGGARLKAGHIEIEFTEDRAEPK